MNKNILRGSMNRILFGLLCVFLMLCISNGFSYGQDANTLAKEANTEIRNAQNKMFSGKHQEAMDILSKVPDILAKIKAADPNNIQLKTLESKYEKLKNDIEKRLPKSEPETPAVKEEAPAPDTGIDLEGLAKEADKELGSAQRNYFNGKHEEAFDQLTKVAEIIGQIKTADPEFAKLATLESKFDKQRKDVEKKLNKNVPLPASLAASGIASSTDMVKAIEKELRDAQNNMFNGKK